MPKSSDDKQQLRQVSLPADKAIRRKKNPRSFPGGIAAIVGDDLRQHAPLDSDVKATVQAADLTFPPNKNFPRPIVASNGGGAIGSALPVQLIFWGSAWNDASVSPSAVSILGDVQNVLSGPFMSGLRQYGVRRCHFGGSIVVTDPAPPATYEDDDVEDMIWALIDDNKFPDPDDPGGRNLYMVFMPPGTAYSGPGSRDIIGKHLVASDYDFPADIDNAWVGFVLTSPDLGTLTRAFFHELAEMCTDPEGDAWGVAGNQEIGDVCNASPQPLNGVTVEPYWSVEDNDCLIPTAYSVRRTLKWSGHKLEGKGITSIQKPIPSLNALILSL